MGVSPESINSALAPKNRYSSGALPCSDRFVCRPLSQMGCGEYNRIDIFLATLKHLWHAFFTLQCSYTSNCPYKVTLLVLQFSAFRFLITTDWSLPPNSPPSCGHDRAATSNCIGHRNLLQKHSLRCNLIRSP